MQARLLAAAVALSAAMCLYVGPAAAQYCDNLEGQDVKVTGQVEKMVDAVGVVFFRDQKTACQFGIVMHRNDRRCKVSDFIEVTGKLIKNKFLPGTYDIDRSGKPPKETLICN